MSEEQSRSWLPNVIGVAALLLAADSLRHLVNTPPEYAYAIVFGHEIGGWAAYLASVVMTLFHAWVSAAAFRRRARTVWAVLVYCAYMIVSVWIWSNEYPTQSLQTRLITSALATMLLLAVCRGVFDRREQFDQG